MISPFQASIPILPTNQLYHATSQAFSVHKNEDSLKTNAQDLANHPSAHQSANLQEKGFIGSDTSNFAQRAEKGLPIVDKTSQIYELIRRGKSAFVMGPRRFGKTLDLTTVEAIFTKGAEWWRRYCGKLDIVLKHGYDFPVHPVLRLDFSKFGDVEIIRMKIIQELRFLIGRYNLSEDLRWEISLSEQFPNSDATFQTLLEGTLQKLASKTGKGVVILIDEYDSPITTLAGEILQQVPDCQDRNLTKHPEMSKLISFLSRFFATIKKHRSVLTDGPDSVVFEYLTGSVPISQLGLFSGANDVFVVRRESVYYNVIGYTEDEIETVFSPHIDDAAVKLLSEAQKQKSGALQDEGLMLERIRGQIKDAIRSNYNGFRFRHDQPTALYSPFAINSLFDSWSRGSNITYPPYFSQSGSSTLLWRSVKMMPVRSARAFLWSLLGEVSEPIFECSPEKLQMNQTLEQLFFDPMRLGFFSGAFSVDQKQSKEDDWKLVITNSEMRKALLMELEGILQLENQTDTILSELKNQNYRGYFSMINQEMAKMSVIFPTSDGAVKSEHEIEAYGHSLFVFLQDRIKDFNFKKSEENQSKVQSFSFYSNKEICRNTRRRPDFLLRFDAEDLEAGKHSMLWIMEFKCKENIEQALQEAKQDLDKKLEDLNALKTKYNIEEFDKCEKIFIAGALGFGKFQSLIFYKMNNKNQLVEFLKLPDNRTKLTN